MEFEDNVTGSSEWQTEIEATPTNVLPGGESLGPPLQEQGIPIAVSAARGSAQDVISFRRFGGQGAADVATTVPDVISSRRFGGYDAATPTQDAPSDQTIHRQGTAEPSAAGVDNIVNTPVVVEDAERSTQHVETITNNMQNVGDSGASALLKELDSQIEFGDGQDVASQAWASLREVGQASDEVVTFTIRLSVAETSEVHSLVCEAVQDIVKCEDKTLAWIAGSAWAAIERPRTDQPDTELMFGYDMGSVRIVSGLAQAWGSSLAGDKVFTRYSVGLLSTLYLVAHGVPYPVAKILGRHTAQLLVGQPSAAERNREKLISASGIVIRSLI